MPEIHLFCEDEGHRVFLSALLRRLEDDYGVQTEIKPFSAQGGAGRMLFRLERYFQDLKSGRGHLPDLVVVARDANCQGVSKAQADIVKAAGEYEHFVVCATPDPHVERWLLLDSAAFKKVLGRGCSPPDQKCEKDRYKRLLIEAVRDAGRRPVIGGLEHAESIVNAMDLDRARDLGSSLGTLITELRRKFGRWAR